MKYNVKGRYPIFAFVVMFILLIVFGYFTYINVDFNDLGSIVSDTKGSIILFVFDLILLIIVSYFYIVNVFVRPTKKVLFLYKDDYITYFYDKDGRKYYEDAGKLFPGKYYNALVTRNNIHEILDECKNGFKVDDIIEKDIKNDEKMEDVFNKVVDTGNFVGRVYTGVTGLVCCLFLVYLYFIIDVLPFRLLFLLIFISLVPTFLGVLIPKLNIVNEKLKKFYLIFELIVVLTIVLYLMVLIYNSKNMVGFVIYLIVIIAISVMAFISWLKSRD